MYDAGGPGAAEEDEGVGVMEEPKLDGGGERLEGLGIVILDESLDITVSKRVGTEVKAASGDMGRISRNERTHTTAR